MMAFFLSLGRRVQLWAVGILAAVLAVLGVYAAGHRDGGANQRASDAQDTTDRLEQGRDAVRDGRASGSPADRLRENGRRW
jgi:hypothetical protein